MIIVRKFTKRLISKVVSLFLVILTLFGSTFISSATLANYEPNSHDDQFAQMLSYKIEGIVADRGEISRPIIVNTLSNFATKFANKDPRFAYIMISVSKIIEDNGINNENINGNITTGFVTKNKLNESNSLLWMTKAELDKDNNKINIEFKYNPDKTPISPKLPSENSKDINTQINCDIFSDETFSGSSTTPSIIAPRGRFYGMSYNHISLNTSNILNLMNKMTGNFYIPDLPDNTYTFMCSIVIVDEIDENNYDNNIAYRSAYYYFDVNIK